MIDRVSLILSAIVAGGKALADGMLSVGAKDLYQTLKTRVLGKDRDFPVECSRAGALPESDKARLDVGLAHVKDGYLIAFERR